MSNDKSGKKPDHAPAAPVRRDDSNTAALKSELNRSYFVMDTHRPPPPIPEKKGDSS